MITTTPGTDAREPLMGKTALVTGGSRGIGAAICRELSGAGASVAVNYRRNHAAAEAMLGELRGDATSWSADVGDTDAVEGMLGDVLDHYGRIDILVANAGIWKGGRIEDLDPADWRHVLETSLTGCFNLVRLALPAMRATGYGRIIVVSSVIGLIGFPGDSAYSTAKAGLFGFVRSVAKECAREDITVNAIAPGFVETDMTDGVGARAKEAMIGRTVLRRPGRPEEIATAARFLACDGSYITGQTLVVDGGMSL